VKDSGNPLKSQQMRPPSERTTPTLGVEISGFFPGCHEPTRRAGGDAVDRRRLAEGGPPGVDRHA